MAPTRSLILIGPGEHFGFELAVRFGNEGFHILLIGRTESRLVELGTRLQEQNISLSYLVADVTDKNQLSNELAKIAKSIPPIELLIFNVKTGTRGNGLALSPQELNQALNSNVIGALNAVQSIVPLIENEGSIIFTGGGYKDSPDPDKLALSVSKGALHTLFLSLIQPLQTQGIKIGTVIIDGVVREGGPIFPRDVVQSFWGVYQSESGKIIELS